MSMPPPYPARIDQPMPNGNYLQVPNPHPYIQQSQPLPNASATLGAVGNYPMACTCPHCHQPVMTRAEKDVGVAVWLSALVLCIFGCFCGCCLIPFCIDDIKDTIHYCPNCNRVIAENKVL